MSTEIFGPRTSKGEPMPPEQKAALEAIGVRFGTGEPLRDFKPLPQRPRWLAFLITLVFGPGG
jgi:hypothetical protein